MAEKKNVQNLNEEVVIAKAKDFWSRYGKLTTVISVVVILLAGGWYVYQSYFKKPKETKAAGILFKAEEYFRADSVSKALNGDGQHWGFLRVIDKYGGTKAGNMACFYAGSCYIKLNENEKALKYLKKFSSSSKPVQASAYKLMADAYADLGKNKDAFEYYEKAARHFEKDETFSADCLLMAAYLAQKNLNDTKKATKLYQELKQKYPRSQQSMDADKYLAQMGVYSTE
ncbi:MAG: tetratricopeptide repeat protein [Bacteroidetes bacterium]|nr:tetratricopeptide repeat protein [Bacteroidota bacterium]